MKSMILSILLLTAAFTLSGCASSGSKPGEVDLKQYLPKDDGGRYSQWKVIPPAPTEENVKQYGRLMTGDEIKKHLNGKVVKGITAYRQFGMNGFKFVQNYRADGTFECLSSGMVDEGKWWVEGDKLCLHFYFFHKEDKICTSVRIKDEKLLTDYNDKKIMDYFEVVN